MNERIYLSPPNIDRQEEKSLAEALSSGWIAPVGPQITSFESKLSDLFHNKRTLLLNSGTSALHLSLVLSDVGEGDIVITSSMTFAACANVILYQKAIPVFIDSEENTWNIDPELVATYLATCNKKPKAIIVTHLYGVPAKLNELTEIASKFGITLIEDAAEALGSTYDGKQIGGFGDFGIISFNGNKIVTTSSGGALVCSENAYQKGLHLSTQANRGTSEYEHDMVGYNYRMSNILAGLGIAQLAKLESFIETKKRIFERYKIELLDFLDFPKEAKPNRSNYWLTTGLMRTDHSPIDVIAALEMENIEARRLWKPLHMQLPYENYDFIGSGICESLFDRGICLPSGTGMTDVQQSRIIDVIKRFFKK